jgi:hypothetical protein
MILILAGNIPHLCAVSREFYSEDGFDYDCVRHHEVLFEMPLSQKELGPNGPETT